MTCWEAKRKMLLRGIPNWWLTPSARHRGSGDPVLFEDLDARFRGHERRDKAYASSTTRLLSVPISGTATSTTSPAFSQRGGSNRAPAPTGVPVTTMSPGLSVVKIVM